MNKTELAGYSLNIHGKNIQVTDPIRNYIQDKLAKIERFSHHLIHATVSLEVQKVEHRVDVILKFDHIQVKVHGVSENMYASIDSAFDKLKARVYKYKERVREHQARGAPIGEVTVNVYKSDEDIVNEDIEAENAREQAERFAMHTIMRKDRRPLKTLTAQEALMKMELSRDHFMLYRGEEDHKLKLIYRMEDGNFGVIEAE